MELNKKTPIQTLHVWRFPYSELIMYRGGQMENVECNSVLLLRYENEKNYIFASIL